MQVRTETHQRQNKEGGEEVDILLDSNGDLAFKGTDIVLANSVRQKIKIRLKWFFQEWRWDDEAGVPYFEYLFVKNPDIRRTNFRALGSGTGQLLCKISVYS